jgi:hemolysin activation/secretion protein
MPEYALERGELQGFIIFYKYMSNKIIKILFFSLAALLISAFFGLSCTFAQPPPQNIESATRQSDVLTDSQRYEKKLKRTPEKPPEIKEEEAAPAPDEEKFLVEKIHLEGCESFPPEDFSSMVSKYENKEVTLTELNTLAKEIEREYLRRGVIAAVFVPPQDIKEKSVTLRVVEAKMGELKVQDAKWFSKKKIYHYWKVYSGETLRYDKISKSIQMMNKNPDREVKAALTAGKKPGTTDVILTPKTNFPAHLTSSYDREGSTSTGKSRIGLGIRHNNFLGLDDTMITGRTFGQDFWGQYVYHSIPISPNGTTMMYGYSISKSIPKKEYSAFGIVSESKDISFSIHQDLFKKDEYLGEIYAGFNANDKTTELNTGTYTRDRLRIFSLGGSYVKRGFGSSLTIAPEIDQGVYGFGSSGKHNPFASRGAVPRFTKFTLSTTYKKILPWNLQLSQRFRNQFSSSKLTPQQQFSIGGIDSVRGYPSGDFLADNAFVSNTELLIPSVFIPKKWRLPWEQNSLRDSATTVVFVDYGWGNRRGALASEVRYVNDMGAGIGMRFSLYNQALVRLEWGFPVTERTITEAAKSQFHFSVDFQEKLPEELERIKKMREEEEAKKLAMQIIDDELNRENSALRERLENYRSLAQAAYEQGDLRQSKELYQRIDEIGKSLYQQSEDYVRSLFVKEEKLRARMKLADAKYQEGKLQEAKQMWEKISEEAKPEPLIFEF